MKLLILFGSMSSEHEISCMSAASILENIDSKKYDINKIGIDKNGDWYTYHGSIEQIKNCTWLGDTNNLKQVTNLLEELGKYDVVFPVLHGKYGEDGTIQGLLELAKVKYVGCGVLSSSVTMDKSLTKKLVSSINIPIVDDMTIQKEKYDHLKQEEKDEYLNLVCKKIAFPMFVKPNAEGSSHGAKKATTIDELKANIDYAFSFDDTVLIEKYIDNRKEVECAILQDFSNVIISTPGEILSANEIYDFEAKYLNQNSSAIIPAKVSNEILSKIKEYSKEIFYLLNLHGLSRVDFFVSNGNIYFNEINTIPGFTNISMFPKMLMHDGLTYSKIIDILIANAN
ncbi:MAG: D-alanine--D-alanine ligase [Clostridia bacterium]|nr:D-alanine--D-alanine ligase [Clostridia bacterium]